MEHNVYEKMWRDLKEFFICLLSLADSDPRLFVGIVSLMSRYECHYGVCDEGDGNGNEC